jgi:Mce-associated membrane protein
VTDDVRENGYAATDFEEDPDADDGSPGESVWRRRRPRELRVQLLTVILVVLLLIAGATATWLFFAQYRPDQQTDQSVETAVLKAASEGTVAVMSYAPDTLDSDFASARSHLTGNFLDYYNQFAEQVVAPASKQKQLKATAHVRGSAVSELRPDSAVVLILVDQTMTAKDNPNPSMAPSSVLVSLIRVNGNWLITKFEPV